MNTAAGIAQVRIDHLNKLMRALGRGTVYFLRTDGRVKEITTLGHVFFYDAKELPDMIAERERQLVERSARAIDRSGLRVSS